MKTILYPNRDARPNSTFTQRMLDLLTAKILSWRQAPGVFGGLHLHSCWNESSVLTRRYQGQTVSQECQLIQQSIALFERSGDIFWRQLAEQTVANVLFLQAPEGGFRHASHEFEPTYTCFDTCPIAQGRPINALLNYAAWNHAAIDLRVAITGCAQRFWHYLADYWWGRGNAWSGRLTVSGWCGVANQDMVVIEAMARYGALTGDWSQYKTYGKPALNSYLSPGSYHEEIGLFERGDADNFAERTSYYTVILPSLEAIDEAVSDERLAGIVSNVRRHMFDALFVDDNGDTHCYWGAVTDPQDKSRVVDWIRGPYVLPAYPEIITHLRASLAAQPDRAREVMVDSLERTLASWVFADGTLPAAVCGANPLFHIVPNNCFEFFSFLIDRLGSDVRSPVCGAVPAVRRRTGDLTYRSNDLFWSIEKNSVRQFAGIRTEPSGIVIGPDESLNGIDLSVLNDYTIDEIVA